MKTNLEKVDLHGAVIGDGEWWRYTETCDLCHRKYDIFSLIHSKKPDLREIDLCEACLRKLVSHDITGKKAKDTFELELDGKRLTVFRNIDGRFLKPGMMYVAKRNTDYQLGKCFFISEEDGVVVPDPPYSMYFYNVDECRVVKKCESI